MKRFCFALKKGYAHRHSLKKYLNDPLHVTSSLSALDPKDLTQRGIHTLILDFDGVLAAHAEIEMPREVNHWLHQAIDRKYFKSIYILSNLPKSKRQQLFRINFPMIQFIRAKRKKPYPDGIQQILQHANSQPENTLLVDDRLLTGCLAAEIANIQAIRVNKPFHKFYLRPVRETFFASLRFFESCLFKIIG